MRNLECGVLWFDESQMDVATCQNIGRDLCMYGVELVLPCSVHYAKDKRDNDALRNLIKDAFDAGVRAGMGLEK